MWIFSSKRWKWVPSEACLMVYLRWLSSLSSVWTVEVSKSRKSSLRKMRMCACCVQRGKTWDLIMWDISAGVASMRPIKFIMWFKYFLKWAWINTANFLEWSVLKARRWGAVLTTMCLHSGMNLGLELYFSGLPLPHLLWSLNPIIFTRETI